MLCDLSIPEVWYLAGLIATDGYFRCNSTAIAISLCGESEHELLQSILDKFESNNYVKYYKSSNNSYQIEISSQRFRNLLISFFNIPEHDKTSFVKVPTNITNEDCIKAYILGCLDGDGCITGINNRKCRAVLLTKSEDFISGLVDIITTYCDCKVIKKYKDNYPMFVISGNKNCLQFLDWVYSTSSTLYLKRKKEKYLKVKDIVCSSMKVK